MQFLKPLVLVMSIFALTACGSGSGSSEAPDNPPAGGGSGGAGNGGGNGGDTGNGGGTGNGGDTGNGGGNGGDAGNGGGNGGDTGNGGGNGGGSAGLPATFASLECTSAANGPIAGPLDPVQTQASEQLAASFADVPELGASAADLVTGTARFLDVLDALAASGSTLFAEQDPAAGGEALDGGALAIQCGAKSLAQAYTNSPLATALPVSSAALVQQLAELSLLFDGTDSVGPASLEELTTRLASIADELSSMAGVLQGFPELLPASVANDTGPLPADGFFALLNAPASLLANLADTLNAAGQLEGQQTADAIATTLSDLLAQAAAFDPSGTLGDGITEAQTQLANGLGLILAPLFDALSDGLGSIGGDVFSDFLSGGIDGFPSGSNPLDVFLGGNMAGFDSLETLLAEVPVLGEVLGLLMASAGEDFDFANPEAPTQLLTSLLAGNGPEGFGDLLGALEGVGSQIQGMAPAGMLPGDASGFPTDAAALGNVLTALEGNSGAALLGELSEALGENSAAAFVPADLQEALGALLGEIDAGADGGLLGSIIGALGSLVNNLLSTLANNPLASTVTGVLGDFSTQSGGLEVGELDSALTDLLDGLGSFAP